MASVLYLVFSSVQELVVVVARLQASDFKQPFTFHRWSTEVIRNRQELATKHYLDGQLIASPLVSRSYDHRGIDEQGYSPGQVNGTVTAEMTSPDAVYSCPVMTELKEGHSFYIRGRVLKTCERFAIDLICSNERRDIALHFNPRLPHNYVVRNSKINGSWGSEERCSALPFLLHRDSTFLIQILVTAAEFLISVNGRHFAHYKHRLPMRYIKLLQVKGDVVEVSCEQKYLKEYPEPASIVKEILYVDDTNQTLNEEERGQFPVPYYGKLQHPFTTSHVLHIHGKLKMLPDSFYVNLQNSDKIWPHPLIHFHFNPRFNSSGDGKHILVANSWMSNDWEKEQRSEIAHKEFYPGRTFQLRIQRTWAGYQVYMNRDLINEYRFTDEGRMEPDTVYIQGDFIISEIFVSNSYEEYPIEED